MYSLITPEEARQNERLRKVPKRRCAGCGGKLNRYAALERDLCTLCLAHDTEARLLFGRRLQAGERVTSDPARLEDIETEALHEALWRIAAAELAADLRVIPAGGRCLPQETSVGASRCLIANRERIRRICYLDDEQRDPGALSILQEQGYLVHAGYSAWSKVATLWGVWRIYPRSYEPLGEPRR